MALYTQDTKTRLVINKKVLLAGGPPVDLTSAEVATLTACDVNLIPEPLAEEVEGEVVEVLEVELPGYQEQLTALGSIGKVPTERSKASVESAYIEHVLEAEVE